MNKIALLPFVLAAASALQAATLVSDPFTDASRSNTTGGDTQGGVWWQSAANTTPSQVGIVDDTAGIGSGNAIQVVPNVDFYRLLTFFPSTTLAATGDSIRVTFDYRFPTAPASAGDGFRLGLANSAGTKQTSDGGSTRNDDSNYGFNTNVGSTSGTGTGVKYEGAGDEILGGSGAGTRSGFGTSGGSVASSTTKHAAMLQITRLTGGDLMVQAQVDALTVASGIHAAASVLTYTFDEFVLGFGGTGYRPTMIIDNVAITTTTQNVLNITATDPAAAKAGTNTATLTVTRSNSSGALTVPYAVTGTATAGVDYEALSGSVSFANGQSSATITVTPLNGGVLPEGSETVIVTLSPPVGTVAQTTSATANITDAYTVQSGQIEPQYSELYTFYITGDGVRLWIDDRLVVARTLVQSGTVRGQMRLVAGQRVNYRIESIGTTPLLEWSSASQTQQIVPGARMSPTRVDKAGGSILREHWSGITGTTISSLTSSANYPNKPSGRELLTSFECLAQDWADNYGTRVTGYIVPPVTGSYTFAVSGDETVELYLSTDATAANKSLIASVGSATAFRAWGTPSAARTLTQGVRYYVELLHKEGTGSDHWSVGWKKPGDSVFSVIPGSVLVQAGLDRAQPAQASLLDTLAQDHPRIHLTAERFAWLKAMYLSPTASKPKTWATSAISSANAILSQAPVTYAQDVRGTILDQARTVKERMYYLGLAWWLTGNNAYADRAWTELNQVADNVAFPDWHPAHFLDTGELSHACAIGYDWFYNYWTQPQRDTIRTAIITKGLNAGITVYTQNGGSWANNWNQVCNGGLAMGALAIGSEDEATTESVINSAINSLRPVMAHFTTDNGCWYEGPGYWTYETEYGTRMMSALETALGSDFGLSATRLHSETAFYPLAMVGPGGLAFNHSDAGSGRVTEDAMQWHARRFNQPLFSWYENTYGSGVLDALWWQDQPVTPAAAGLQPDFCFHGENSTSFKPVDATTLRTNWTDTRGTFVGSKGGWMGADHGNLDAGDFVLDALGKRWFVELGGDDYALSGYFNQTPNAGADDRWDYYRNRGEGQNTIIVNPGSGPNMIYNTVTPLIAYQSEATGRRSMAIYDMTPSTSGVTKLWRGFQLLGNRNQVLVQDEIQAGSGKTVWWFAHFSGTSNTVVIDPDGSAATLTQGAERLWCKIVNGGGTFQVLDAVPLATSPAMPLQNANTGFKKLAINLTGVTNTTLAVWMVPLSPGENPPPTPPAITPLSSWNLTTINDAPSTPNVAATTIGDQVVDIDLSTIATDDATESIALGYAVSSPINGTVTLLGDGHTARFTPTANYTGVASFTYTATDAGSLSSSGVITITAQTNTHIWNATADGSWTTGANWASAVAPTSSRGNSIEFFTSQTLATNVTATNDNASFQLNALTLNGTSNAVATSTIAGNALTLTNNNASNPVVNLNATTGSGFSYDVNTPLVFAMPVTFQGNGNAAFRFNGALSGAGSLTKAGTSGLILTGSSSYAGDTTVSAGMLQVGHGGSTGSLPAGNVITNATLRLHRGDTALIVPNTISGTGTLQFGVSTNGVTTSVTTLSGSNSFSGSVTGNSGGLRITNSNALGTGTKTVTMANGNGGNPHLRLDGSGGSIDLPATMNFVVSNTSTVNGAFLNEAGNNIIRGPITFSGGNGDTRLLASAGTITFTGTMAPNTTGRNLQLDGAANGVCEGAIGNGLSGTGIYILSGVNKSGTGTWTLGGSNSHGGTTTVTTGTLMITHPNALGTGGITLANATSGTNIASTSGAVLDLNGQQNLNEVFTLRGTGISNAGALINSSTTPASIGSGTIASISTTAGGVHSSVPDVTITGGGGSGATAVATLGLSAASFTINGGTTVYSTPPTVSISGGGGVGASATAVLSGGSIGTVTGITISATNAGTGYSTAPSISFSGGAITTAGTNPTGTGNATNFVLSGIQVTNPGSGYTSAPTVNFSTGTGTTATANLSSVNLAAATTIGGSGDIVINPGITGGSNALTKVGAGNLTLNGANTFTGATTVSAGTLVLNGTLTSSITAASGGTLIHPGSITGNVTIQSGGLDAPTTGTSLRSITGNFSLNSGGTLRVRLNGSTAGTQHDQLVVSGTVTLGGALDVVCGPALAPGSTFRILDKAGATTTATTFTGKAENSTFVSAEGYTFRINYNAGTGNDIVLTLVTTPIEQWRFTNYGSVLNTGSGLDSADTDGDGTSNLMEYATKMNTAANDAVPQSAAKNGSVIDFTYTKNKSATDVTFVVEWSDDLTTWSTSGVSAPTVLSDNGVTQQIKVTVPAGSGVTKRFVHLKVTRP